MRQRRGGIGGVDVRFESLLCGIRALLVTMHIVSLNPLCVVSQFEALCSATIYDDILRQVRTWARYCCWGIVSRGMGVRGRALQPMNLHVVACLARWHTSASMTQHIHCCCFETVGSACRPPDPILKR